LLFSTIASDLLHGGGIEDRIKSDTLDLTDPLKPSAAIKKAPILPHSQI